MPSQTPFDINAILVQYSLQFIVLWEKGKHLEGAQVAVSGEVTQHLQRACRTTLNEFRKRELVEYSSDGQVEPEQYAYAAGDVLVSDSPIGKVLFSDTALPLISGRDLAKHKISLYAVLVGTDEDRRVFVKKRDPQVRVKAGRMLSVLGDVLERLDAHVFTLDDSFDLIAAPQGVIALQQKVFEDLFKDALALQARVPQLVTDTLGHLRLSDDLTSKLIEKCQRDSRLRRRLYAMRERGHLVSVTLDDLRNYIHATGLSNSVSIVNGQLVASDDCLFDLMYLLNEDFYSGGITGASFRSERKSQR